MKYIASFLAVVSLAVFIGCHTPQLAPGGAYAPVDTNGVPTQAADPALYLADSAYNLAHSTMDLVFTYEYNNRATLWKISPSIKQNLDLIRPQAVLANSDYLRARAGYMANPTKANLDTLNAVLGKLQQITQAAQAVLPQAIGAK